MTADLQPEIGGLPNICGSEDAIAQALAGRSKLTASPLAGSGGLGRARSAFAIGLHMHQPLVPADGPDLHHAPLISNLRKMAESSGDEPRYNAGIFRWCYQRMGKFVPELAGEGKQPCVMLDYSGTLLWGLQQMGANDVLDDLRTIACDLRYRHYVEWMGTSWGHSVAPSTPVQDFKLHVRAWQHHFAALFGIDALASVRGFSPPEMALPNHPDVAFEFVKTLRECGYEWVLVQEHSVEDPQGGRRPRYNHLPHRLVCRNSAGESAEIVAIIKTQGSDTKLVGQMQPYYEAQGLSPLKLADHSVPQLVTQIADGENGGVMMNEFPPKYKDVIRECSGSDVPITNVSDYLGYVFSRHIAWSDLPVLQPVHQAALWDRFKPGDGAAKLKSVIQELGSADSRFNMEGGSWTNDVSWVRGYEGLLGPMEELSSTFYEKVLRAGVASNESRYRNVLFHLLVSQTSCYRYWGQGPFVEYGKEICRRGMEILRYDF